MRPAADRRQRSSRWSAWSEDSLLSIASKDSVLSIGSVGSCLSIGSVGSCLSIASVGSFASAGAALSAASRWSLLSWRSVGALTGAKTVGARGSRLGPPVALLAIGLVAWLGQQRERRARLASADPSVARRPPGPIETTSAGP
jgi:hypothetical protein